MDHDDERRRIVEEFRETEKRQTRSDVGNSATMSAVGAGLAWWAYGTVAHAVLFAFVIFAVGAAANRAAYEIRRSRLAAENRELLWRQDERLDAEIEAGRIRRRGDA